MSASWHIVAPACCGAAFLFYTLACLAPERGPRDRCQWVWAFFASFFFGALLFFWRLS